MFLFFLVRLSPSMIPGLGQNKEPVGASPLTPPPGLKGGLFLERGLGGSPLQRHCLLQGASPQNRFKKRPHFWDRVWAGPRDQVRGRRWVRGGGVFDCLVDPGFATGGLMMAAAIWLQQSPYNNTLLCKKCIQQHFAMRGLPAATLYSRASGSTILLRKGSIQQLFTMQGSGQQRFTMQGADTETVSSFYGRL